MFAYFLKRILLVVPSVMAVILLMFVMMASLKGTNTARMVRYADDAKGTQESLSFMEQYGKYCYRVFVHQDFGVNELSGIPLRHELMIRTGITLRTIGITVLFTYLLGIPLGIYAACRRGGWQDTLVTALTTLFSALPSFCLAMALVLIFALRLRWVHVMPVNAVDELVPLSVLTALGTSNVAKVTRASMAEVLDQPFILSLSSLGISRRSVIFRHGLKNALVPAFSMFSTVCAQLLCGAVVVEHFFNLRGLGSMMIGAINRRATTTIMGSAAIIAFIMSICSIVNDLLFVLVKPALRRSLRFGMALRRQGGKGSL